MSSDTNGFEDQVVEVDIDASGFLPRQATGASLKSAQQYLEKLKQYCPEEYARIMADRKEQRKEDHQ